MIHYQNCPFCHSVHFQHKLTAKDYTVTGQTFSICQCNDCSGAFTQDIPDNDAIGAYYAAESYVSHSNTQKGFINQLYHFVRSYTLNSKKRMVQHFTSKERGNIADIGCGTGAFLHTMQQAGWQITGLEPDATARQNAKAFFGIEPLLSHEIFALPDAGFDAVTMWHVLEHVHQLHEYVDQIKKILKPGGKLFVAVPNYTSYDANNYQQYWAAFDVPRHLYHFSPASMKALMRQHGMEVINTKPMWFDSFYVSMLSEKYRNGKGNIVAAFLVGLIANFKALLNKEKCSSVIYVIQKK